MAGQRKALCGAKIVETPLVDTSKALSTRAFETSVFVDAQALVQTRVGRAFIHVKLKLSCLRKMETIIFWLLDCLHDKGHQ